MVRPIRLLHSCLAAVLVAACGGPAATNPPAGGSPTSETPVSLPPSSAPSEPPTPVATLNSPFAVSPIPSAVPSLVPALSVDHPQVLVTPDRGLRDTETVEVRVTGFGVGGKVWVSECASAQDASSLGCGAQLAAQPFLATDESRAGQMAFTVSLRAPTRPMLATPTATCTNACVIVATVGDGFGYATAPMSFAGG